MYWTVRLLFSRDLCTVCILCVLPVYTVCVSRGLCIVQLACVFFFMYCNLVSDCVSADVRHLLTGITVLAQTPNHRIAPRNNAEQFIYDLHCKILCSRIEFQ